MRQRSLVVGFDHMGPDLLKTNCRCFTANGFTLSCPNRWVSKSGRVAPGGVAGQFRRRDQAVTTVMVGLQVSIRARILET